MSDRTKIEWADATVNAVNGCDPVSPGCTNCYAMRLAGTRLKHHPSRAGLTRDTKAGPVWTGEVRLSETALLQPLRWRRPRRIFWNAHGDLFHEAVPDVWIDRVFAVCAFTPHHQHLILTKRSARMREYVIQLLGCGALRLASLQFGDRAFIHHWIDPADCPIWKPLPNVWLGVSVEDQTRADERIPDLLATPAAVRWISAEPLLGPVDLTRIHESFDEGLGHSWESCLNGKRFDIWGDGPDIEGCSKIDWIVAGGESGPGARPMHPDWPRSLRDQCAAANVPFFFKQWGEWLPASQTGAAGEICSCGSPNSPPQRVGKKRAGRLLDGIEHNAFPRA